MRMIAARTANKKASNSQFSLGFNLSNFLSLLLCVWINGILSVVLEVRTLSFRICEVKLFLGLSVSSYTSCCDSGTVSVP